MIQERNKDYYCIVYQTDNVLLFVNKTYQERYEYSAYNRAEFRSKHAAKKVIRILTKISMLIDNKELDAADKYIIKYKLSDTYYTFMREFYHDLQYIKIIHIIDKIKYC